MQKWEYHTVKQPDFQKINELGSQGWELIIVIRDDQSNTSVWVFKRPLP